VRERGVVVRVDRDVLIVRVGSAVCGTCSGDHCRRRSAEIRVRRLPETPVSVGDRVQVRVGFFQSLGGFLRLTVPPAVVVIAGMSAGLQPVPVVFGAIFVVAVVTLLGERTGSLPVIDDIVPRSR